MKVMTYASVAAVHRSLCLTVQAEPAQITRFPDRHSKGKVIEYWRLTHDPAIRDWADYHNQKRRRHQSLRPERT